MREFENIVRMSSQMSEALEDTIDAIATLSAVDGALVMTDNLHVLGFGGRVTEQPPEIIRASKDAHITGTQDLRSTTFGTRHGAAFAFARSVEHSVVFVLSQDGGVKAVRRVGDHVVIWPDIDLNIRTLRSIEERDNPQ